ncbi:MAG: hypothetical protein A3J37_07400 [Alphaproteobacteria bacterium RIFCSPHIGHO2_12_FULL_45_9]|nr:MAG: hypothetical protein A3B66_08540 [Alphaproteobacteria bacterium RIFCSPHIGHO2_02_FULL_46_13]OFW95549.1 MAG: hypothetical protein A3J37_07400 [Alphaproteobacteria bacterium RIFCSPHIGHO2_12_FULL_45_9]
MEATLSNIGAEIETCNNAVWDTQPRLKKILFVSKSDNPTKTKANPDYIRMSDKQVMSQLIETSRNCRDRGQEKIKNNPDYYVRSFAPIAQESTDLRNNIYTKYLHEKITGGEAASSLENVIQYLVKKWEDHQRAIISQLDQQHFQQLQSEAAMWQAMGSTFQNYNQQQQAYQNSYNQQQVNKPIHTQCRWDADVMNCSSYQY